MFVVVGATGKTGGAVVRRLLEEQQPVRAIVRQEASAEALRASGVNAELGDVDAGRSVVGRAIPIQTSHPFRFEAGHRSDVKSARVPI